ncbi:MAG: hypothetical protein IJQ37_07770 [Clostridia bacterium]|nr:hypothetical protein [Clostridia bacterium]
MTKTVDRITHTKRADGGARSVVRPDRISLPSRARERVRVMRDVCPA